jgi:aryl-alcohol dehydrogenase-like predicted oxidoreductase
METRALGDTGQESSVLTFGAIALNYLEQEAANRLVELALDRGVNHVDVAPRYGDAELKLGPKLRQHREEIFLGCKTQKRDYDGARRKLDQSLNRLGVEQIDLYQFHALETREELETLLGEDGALAAVRDAREAGLIEHVGLTGHAAPDLLVEAMERIDDLETVMCPMNPVVAGKEAAEYDYRAVLDRAEQLGIGTLCIKAFAAGPWPAPDELAPGDRPYNTWYEPVDTPEAIRDRFDFAAAQGVTSVVSPGDPALFGTVLDAAARSTGMDEATQREVIEAHQDADSPVPEQLHS